LLAGKVNANKWLDEEILQCIAHSLLPSYLADISPYEVEVPMLTTLVEWFQSLIKVVDIEQVRIVRPVKL
jgi:hypothetical protein